MLVSKYSRFSRNLSRYSQVLWQQVKPKESAKPKESEKPKNELYHDAFDIKYKKLGINDKMLSSLIMTVKSKKRLTKEDQIIVEGKKLIAEAVMSHFKLNTLLFSHIEKIEDVVNIMGKSTSSVDFIKVPQQDLTFYSVLTTCPGLIGIFEKPRLIKPKENPLPITIICDNLREPNNLGAVIRLANALPAVKVLLPKGCADPWDVKAIRGSSGSIFYMPTEDSLPWEHIETYHGFEDALVLIADNNVTKYDPEKVLSYDQIPIDLIAGKQIYLMIGGETHGISDEARSFAFNRNWRAINIPLDATVNSLNTSNALAIVLFELRRKLINLQ